MTTRASAQYLAIVLISVLTMKNSFAADINIFDKPNRSVFLNSPPTLSLSPQGPYVVNENDEIQIQLIGSDLDPDEVLYYSANGLNSGSQLDPSTGLFKWKPQYNQAGIYKIIFFVTDRGGLSDTASVIITVNDVNRPPAFTTIIPPNTVIPYYANNEKTYVFLYTANDPDGDPLVFSLETKIEGVSVATNGILMWTVKKAQSFQKYVVSVKVTDGIYYAETSAVVSVGDYIIADTFTDVELSSNLPNEFMLYQNYPNPFNPTTNIKFALPKESNVKLRVYSILGEEVALLVNKGLPAGNHTVDFNAAGLSTGIYVYRIEAENFVSMKKMLLVK